MRWIVQLWRQDCSQTGLLSQLYQAKLEWTRYEALGRGCTGHCSHEVPPRGTVKRRQADERGLSTKEGEATLSQTLLLLHSGLLLQDTHSHWLLQINQKVIHWSVKVDCRKAFTLTTTFEWLILHASASGLPEEGTHKKTRLLKSESSFEGRRS